ncbi:MAG: gliding motility lipoprotein GldD [Flavobacteriales bacterium]|nr:gliding motility lipoprotein GldD [Flavobacteriales bacterium]MCB9193342.1 gliding motility lipoprotein GldD [Flavobacteriales bacterium]
MVGRSCIGPLLVGCVLVGCGGDPVPKPHGYFRIDLPEQGYALFTSDCFLAEIPKAARMVPQHADERPCWYNITYPGYKAAVHLTYRHVQGDLGQLLADAHDFKNKHEAKAFKITTERLLRDTSRVFGDLFDVEGDVASPMVFYLTDSTTNFLYGSLYFRSRPNADSLAPITTRIRQDIRHFASTLRWVTAGPSDGPR